MARARHSPKRPAVFDSGDPAIQIDDSDATGEGPEAALDLEREDMAAGLRLELNDQTEPIPPERAVAAQEPKGLRRAGRIGGVLLGALGALVSLGAGLAVTQLVEDLFQRSEYLGWLALGLAGIAGVALLMLLVREVAGLIRLRRIANLRAEAERAHRNVDMGEARAVLRHVKALYHARDDLSWGMSRLKEYEADIFDADDLLRLAERELMAPLDRAATALVARAARRVSVVTAVSPMALVDMGFVLWSNLGLLRALATLYGGRPGYFALFKLAGMVVTHLTVTGGVALGDSIMQQILGHGVAARVSARLGEGVLNGLFTARIGLAAINVCRPLPYQALNPPALSAVMGGVVKFRDKKK